MWRQGPCGGCWRRTEAEISPVATPRSLLNWALLLNDGDNRIETHHKLSLSFEFCSEFTVLMFQQLYFLHFPRQSTFLFLRFYICLICLQYEIDTQCTRYITAWCCRGDIVSHRGADFPRTIKKRHISLWLMQRRTFPVLASFPETIGILLRADWRCNFD